MKESGRRISVTKQALSTGAQAPSISQFFLPNPHWQSTQPAGWESINMTATKGWQSQGATQQEPEC